jgi:hypothetical protein
LLRQRIWRLDSQTLWKHATHNARRTRKRLE